jgi:hypothetical protein
MEGKDGRLLYVLLPEPPQVSAVPLEQRRAGDRIMAIPINAASAILTGDKKPEDRGRNKRQVEDPAPTPPSAAKPNTRVGDISSGGARSGSDAATARVA